MTNIIWATGTTQTETIKTLIYDKDKEIDGSSEVMFRKYLNLTVQLE